MLFPVKFADIDPFVIRKKLFALYDEGTAREDIAKLQLRLKGHFLDESLENVVLLATDIFTCIEDERTIDAFFKYKSHVFTSTFDKLNAHVLLQNLHNYRALKAQERQQIIKQLYARIDHLYAEEIIKPEKL